MIGNPIKIKRHLYMFYAIDSFFFVFSKLYTSTMDESHFRSFDDEQGLLNEKENKNF